MYVCICNGHRDSEIAAAARQGLTCPRKIYRSLGKPVRCGRCLDTATEIVAQIHAPGAPSLPAGAALAPAGRTAAD